MALIATSFASGCGIGDLLTEPVDDEQLRTAKKMMSARRPKAVADSHQSGMGSQSLSRTGWFR